MTPKEKAKELIKSVTSGRIDGEYYKFNIPNYDKIKLSLIIVDNIIKSRANETEYFCEDSLCWDFESYFKEVKKELKNYGNYLL